MTVPSAERKVRVTARQFLEANTGREILRLCRCPQDYRVCENDFIENDDGGHALYPSEGGAYRPEEFGYYTEAELLEAWPELAVAVGSRALGRSGARGRPQPEGRQRRLDGTRVRSIRGAEQGAERTPRQRRAAHATSPFQEASSRTP